MKSVKLNKFIGIVLFSLLFIFPFSFQNLNTKWNIFFAVALGFISIILFLKKHIYFKKPVLLTVLTIIFLVVFDFAEKVNFSQLFDIQNPVGWRIPISTILLSIATFAFLIKMMIAKKLVISFPQYIKYFFIAIFFLLILMMVFYPFMSFHYNMSLDLNIQLLNKILKYGLLLFIIFTNFSSESQFRNLGIGLCLTISVGLCLSFFL
jgi:hypothetical protein